MQICVEFTGLQGDQQYRLLLPEGTQYNAGAGSLRANLTSGPFSGLLPFSIPLADTPPPSSSREAYKGVTSRRLELLMPHGLSDDTSADAIAARLQLQHVAPPWTGNASSGAPEDVPFEVELVAECALCPCY